MNQAKSYFFCGIGGSGMLPLACIVRAQGNDVAGSDRALDQGRVAVMKNFVTPDTPFASALVGDGGVFVSEVDESDGSISLYEPEVAVLTNITLDHKTMEELHALFRGFLSKAKTPVLNLDDEETRRLASEVAAEHPLTYSFRNPDASLLGSDIAEEPLAISFKVSDRNSGETVPVRLGVPGRHNASNALAAMAAARAAGVDLARSAEALSGFTGLRRRFEVVGTKNNVTVIDDFGHNPDKIAATLQTLHAFPGRLLIMFQPHGYGPLRTMRKELIDCFVQNLAAEDVLVMPDPVYQGGTVDRSV